MKDYMIGCNYWASHAGTEMWAQWDEAVVDRDFAELVKYGVRSLRVFPNWRDFQPIHLARQGGGQPYDYYMHGKTRVTDPYALDEEQLQHFHTLCKLAEKHGITLLVSIVTGWMSGRLFVPPMLEGKAILTDPEALMWQHRFVRAFVRDMKSESAIEAWDLGNECNCMTHNVTKEQAYIWLMTVSNAIRLEDDTRPVISGMHGITPEGAWNFTAQGELTDMVTPHPYPSIFSNQDTEPLNELKTTMYPTAQILYYAGLSGKPAMIEETGTFNDMLGCPETAAAYINTSMFSGWANGSTGMLWWCAHEQKHLLFPPYDANQCENELGLLREDYSPKPVALAMQRFTAMLDTMPFDKLPPKVDDAVCILTHDQNPLMVSLAVTTLCKQAGFEARFVNHDQAIPEAQVYLLPCLMGSSPLTITTANELFARVKAGATLYLSFDTGLIGEFQQRTGLKPITRQNRRGTVTGAWNGDSFPFCGGKELTTELDGCEALMRDEHGTILFSRHALGKGWVYVLSAPMEQQLAETPGAFYLPDAAPYYKLYQELARPLIEEKPLRCPNPMVGLTHHPFDENRRVCILMNYSSKPQTLDLALDNGWRMTALFGDAAAPLPANDALIVELTRDAT